VRELAGCRKFPTRLTHKPELNSAAFYQASLFAEMSGNNADELRTPCTNSRQNP
jgi:hypothetical protein